jgi:hypothetical protein
MEFAWPHARKLFNKPEPELARRVEGVRGSRVCAAAGYRTAAIVWRNSRLASVGEPHTDWITYPRSRSRFVKREHIIADLIAPSLWYYKSLPWARVGVSVIHEIDSSLVLRRSSRPCSRHRSSVLFVIACTLLPHRSHKTGFEVS